MNGGAKMTEYRLRAGDTVLHWTVTRDGENTLTLIREGRTMGVRYRVISAGHFYMEVDGRGMNVYARAENDVKPLIIDGAPCAVEDEDRQRQVKKKSVTAPREITPPMPSVVVKVLVSTGDEVKQGAPVIVVSAMKMETTLTAPFDGTVVSVNAAAGDKVMPGQILVDIRESAGPA